MALFSEIIGQEHIKEHLKNAIISGMPSHAYIIQGEEGMGKSMVANAFAGGLLCETGAGEPCLKCHSCKQFMSGNHPDVRIITSEKSNIIKVDEVRKQIIDDIQIKPYSSDYKIYIIPNAQRMNPQAQNALLKTLEEPPQYAVIMLLCTNAKMLLDTIVSRCVTLDIRPLKDSQVSECLMKRYKKPDYMANVIAAFARGSIGRALLLAEDEAFIELRDTAMETVSNLKRMDVMAISDMIKRILALATPPEEFLDYLLLMYRDALVYKSTNSDSRLLFKNDIKLITEMARDNSFEHIENVIREIAGAKNRLRVNVNKDLTLELLILTMQRGD